MTIQRILHNARTVAVVGLSKNELRAIFFVGYYLKRHGYRVIPVNQRLAAAGGSILGEKAYPSVRDVPGPFDMVDFYLRSSAVGPVVDEAIAVAPEKGIRVLWMQLGVRDDAAAERAEKAGLQVVMNRCPKIEYGRLSSEIGWIGVNSRTLSSKRAPLLGKGVQRMSLNRSTMAGGATEAATRAQAAAKEGET